MLQQWVTSHSSSIIKRHNCIFFATIVTCHVWRLLVSYLKQAPWETLFKFKHNGRAAFRILGGTAPDNTAAAKAMSALRSIDGQHLFFSGWHLYRWPLSSAGKTPACQQYKNQFPWQRRSPNFQVISVTEADRRWAIITFFFFCLLHLACAAFSSTYLPPVELSCSITAPITLLKLFLRLSLIFLSLIPIYFPKPHPWVQMGNIREEIKRLKSSLLQVKFLFFQRHEAGSRL